MKKLFTPILFSLCTILGLKIQAQGFCDRHFNFVAGQDTGYLVSIQSVGFAAGNNALGDLAAAEKFSGARFSTVDSAVLGVAYATVGATDSLGSLMTYVYDASGPGGTPGNAIDSSPTLLTDVSLAAHFHSGFLVNFPNQPPLPTQDFFIVVKYPQVTGDTIAMYTNSFTSYHGRGYTEDAFGDWTSLDSLFGLNPPFHMGTYVIAYTCGGAAVPNFSAAPKRACDSLRVQYTDLSSHSPTSWHWTFTGGTPSSSTAENPVVTYYQPGSYSATLIASNASGSDTLTLNNIVAVYKVTDGITSTPATGAVGAANGTATITSVTGGLPPYRYLWSDSSTTAADSGLVAGLYKVTITDSLGCHKTDSVVVTFINGINELGEKQVNIYPNPANDILNVQWSIKTVAEISLEDMNGKTVRQFVVNGTLFNSFDIHDMPSGVYILRITDKETLQQQSAKFIKF